ncbi:MAG TPA: DUF1491 family protein [Novosphingobium sp.]|nr:DUF1491 family protein [Novosphingobium sp.]HZV09809.1 DUF1491 family protein [Novosphingobium sp.]
MSARLPAGVEVSALIRRVQQEGGFATVLARGEAEAGTILLVLLERGAPARAVERMPMLDGTRAWQESAREDTDNTGKFTEWVERRHRQDPDLWVLELDIPSPERFIELSSPAG